MSLASRFRTMGDRLKRRRDRDRYGSDSTVRASWPDVASTALKPGQMTWLVARAVSLRAF
jgi:hypothetical protein